MPLKLKMEADTNQMDDLNIFQKRAEIMENATLSEKDRIQDAVKLQDTIRSKIRNWNGSKEIRKWRERA